MIYDVRAFTDEINTNIRNHDVLVQEYFNRQKMLVDVELQRDECCICLENIPDQKLNCCHYLCKTCYINNTEENCPLCRMPYEIPFNLDHIKFYDIVNDIVINPHSNDLLHDNEHTILKHSLNVNLNLHIGEKNLMIF